MVRKSVTTLQFNRRTVVAETDRRAHPGRACGGKGARGRKGGRPRIMDRPTLMMAMTALADPKSNAVDVANRLGITTTTLYDYVNGDGSAKAVGQTIINKGEL